MQEQTEHLPLPPKRKVVLVGNPNVGKSLFFNFLSGTYVDVSNFPGTTVSVTKGNYKDFEIYDTPGIYGVSSFNDEERVAQEIILDADIILNVVNSLHLERDLFLTQQLIDMGKPVAVFLNFDDERKKRNIVIETGKLSEKLGVPVICSSAREAEGFESIHPAISAAVKGKATPGIDRIIRPYAQKYGEAHGLILAEADEYLAGKLSTAPGSVDEREAIYLTRRNHVNELVAEIEYENTKQGKILNSFGMLSLHPLTGIPILILILFAMYFIIGDIISQRIVSFTEKTIGKGIVEFHIKKLVSRNASTTITVSTSDSNLVFSFPAGTITAAERRLAFEKAASQKDATSDFYFANPLIRLFFGEFGVITMTITYLVFLLLPLVLAFYFAMAFLEDSGYLPRLATMMDRILSRLGLNGKAIIPILLGFGCVTMATITTRILGSNRERTIATAILQFVIPCSAQLAVITFLMSSAGIAPLMIYTTVIVIVLVSISTLLNKSLPGISSPLLLDLPMMDFPKIGNVLKKTYHRSFGFMEEAAVWFFIGALFIGVLEITGLLIVFQKLLAPLTIYWLKLPGEAATAFIMGLVRRDFGTAGLFHMPLSPMQKSVAIITITLFVPCIASFMVMLKERGWKEGIIIWVCTWIGAFTIGGIVAQIIV